MRYVKLVLVYSFMIIPLIRFIAVSLNNYIGDMSGYFFYVTIFVMLLHAGIIIENNAIKKKYLIYVAILFGEIFVIVTIAEIFNIGTLNTWLGFLSGNIILATIVIALFDMSKLISEIDIKTGTRLRSISIIIAVVIVLTNTVIIFDWGISMLR